MKSPWMLWAWMAAVIPGVHAQDSAPLVPILDYDGMLIEAISPNYKIATDRPAPNTYSCVILRMLQSGKLTTTVLGGAFYRKPKVTEPDEQVNIGNILDLNGDGVLEIVLHSHYYEGSSTTVFEVKSGAPIQVLKAEDGV